MWFKFLVPRVINASSVIVAQSAFTKNELMELLKVPEKKIHIVYPGISKKFISPRKAKEKKETSKTILAVSTLEPRKNLKRLIEAFNSLESKDAKLVIVGGDNSLVFGKNAKVVSDPNVIFLGYISDSQLADLYHQADIFASVSLYEGFGFPPLEALASGCKVLVSDIPSHREVFGECATYVNPLDTEDISKKLNLFLDKNDEEDFSQTENTLSKFDWHRAAEELLRITKIALHVD